MFIFATAAVGRYLVLVCSFALSCAAEPANMALYHPPSGEATWYFDQVAPGVSESPGDLASAASRARFPRTDEIRRRRQKGKSLSGQATWSWREREADAVRSQNV